MINEELQNKIREREAEKSTQEYKWCDHYKVTVPEGKSGSWAVERFIVPENDYNTISYALDGRPVLPGRYTRLTRNGNVIMSDTPAEIIDHFAIIFNEYNEYEKSRVLINGLGLGVVVQALLNDESIIHIDVVENSEDVIKLIAPHYQDSRIHIHHADAFDVQWPSNTRWSTAWHDIWDNITSTNLSEMARLTRKYEHCCDWQGSWAQEECRFY